MFSYFKSSQVDFFEELGHHFIDCWLSEVTLNVHLSKKPKINLRLL
ncbi:hypothetical protein VCRA2122O12_460002 [Vibrio crassostreae]|jgi:hypothetical protein|nr:hypothetical protein VCRA2119O381_2190002 [Vibrio crassostreae]CAK2197663.1 hypothetical protein VCRA2110O173_670003 [Vibrio crassostreae]CAK2899928.1 hypothetical protein VCRA2119O149_4190004 [Vibrio crassostreae]CAK3127044.1 hypothetical protein VCRA2127O302_590002 [Vibrio crassostreae]CAK3464046.1 hypothetical protein VCRA2128O94_570003 [Vibrio crassostreae]